jgi:hypothetical protein
MSTLTQQLDEFLAGWRQRVPPERQAAMERHIAHLAETGFGRQAAQVGDQAPDIVLPDANGKPIHIATMEKNALTFPVLSDVGQRVGKAFGLVYAFTEELRTVYDGFKLDIPGKNGSPDDWALPLSATYVIGPDGRILFADTSVDYRRRTDPLDVLQVLEHRLAAE